MRSRTGRCASTEHSARCPSLFRFEYKSLPEVVDAAKTLNPHFREGFVVCDHRFNRVKVSTCAHSHIALETSLTHKSSLQIKAPQYVALAHLTRKDRVRVRASRSSSLLLCVCVSFVRTCS